MSDTSDELDDLYQQVIMDHSKSPRNFGKIEAFTHHAEGYNPLCGDHFGVDLILKDGIVVDVKFNGAGCAISTSSASLMTEAVRGLPTAEAEALFERMHALVTDRPDPGGPDLGKLEAFAGVRNFPMRVKCATLAWHAFHAALNGVAEPISTE